MHRQELLKKLQGYRPIDAEDAHTRKEFERFVTAHANCFERSLTHGHITGSAWVLNHLWNAVLLTHHRKLNKWIQLGGHTDGNPDTFQSALREAQEESGIQAIKPLSESIFDLDIHSIPAHGEEPAHLHYDVRYAFAVRNSQPFSVSAESIDLEWVPLDQLDAFTPSRSIQRMKRKWQENWLKLQ